MFCQSNLLFGRSDGKFRGRNAKFQAPEFFFRGSEFLFRGSDGKIPVQKPFRGGSGGVFLSRWNFSPNTFPVSFCRRNPPTGFPAGRVSAPEVPRVPSKGQVWRGFRDILISARRVWLRFFRAVPARRTNTRISEGENEQIVNATRKYHIVNIGGAAFLPHNRKISHRHTNSARMRVYQNKLLRLVGEVARSDGGVSRPQRHTLCVCPWA